MPYLILVVELVEQAGLLMLTDMAFEESVAAELKVGAPMQVWFDAIAPDFTLPQFRFAAVRTWEAG